MIESSSSAKPHNLKRDQILSGAKQVFLGLGYEGTSAEEIARCAKVSKGTLYNYFPDKRSLFTAVLEGECQAQAQRIFQIERKEESIEAVLHQIARGYVEFLLSPFAQSMFRVAIAEAQRFPELGQAFYQSGPNLGTTRLQQFFVEAVEQNELAIDDLELAAHQFIELCKADLFYKRLLCVETQVNQAEVERIASGAVATFLQAFGQ